MTIEDNIWTQNELRYFERIVATNSKIPGKLSRKSFIKEVVIQPLQLNAAAPRENKLQETALIKISKANYYGGMYFTLLDAQIDSDALLFDKTVSVLGSYLRRMYIKSLVDLDPFYDWEKWLKKMGRLQKPSRRISESEVIERSEPLFKSYLVVSQVDDTDFLSALNSYLLAKQYNDDLHDFIEDLETKRNTLVTRYLVPHADPYRQFVLAISPMVIEKIEEHLLLSESILKHFSPLKILRLGLKRYEAQRKNLVKNFA
jgi:hypothetical protein